MKIKLVAAGCLLVLIAGIGSLAMPVFGFGINIKVPTEATPLEQFFARQPQWRNKLQHNDRRAVVGSLAALDLASSTYVINDHGRYWAISANAQTLYRRTDHPLQPQQLRVGDRILAFGQPDPTQNSQAAYIIKLLR